MSVDRPLIADPLTEAVRLDGDPLLFDGDGPVLLQEFNPHHDQRGRFAPKNMAPAAALDALAAGGQPNVRPQDVGAVLDLAAQRSDHPDLTELHVSGTLKFGDDGLGIARKDMPQLDARAPEYVANLRSRGIKVTTQTINPQRLKPTQKEVSATSTGKLLGEFRDGSMQKKLNDDPSWRSIVSKDNYVLDGHHRWGAAVAYSFEKPGFTVPITKVDLPMSKLLSDAEGFTVSVGIAKKALGEARLVEFNPNHDQKGRFAPKRVPIAVRAVGGGFEVDGVFVRQGVVSAVRDWQMSFADVNYIQENPNSLMARDFMMGVEQMPVVKGEVYRGIREYKQAPLNSGVGTYRREKTPSESLADWRARIGKTIQVNEPTSTSPDYHTAARFGSTIFKIDHGGTAHDIRPLSRFPDFNEAVMKPGTFKVTGVKKGPPLNTQGGAIKPYHDNTGPNLVVTLSRVGD